MPRIAMTCVYEIFKDVVSRMGDREAVCGEGGRFTYAELDAAADRIAGGLAARGIDRGDFVPVLVGRSPWFVAAILGILKRGAAYVPLDESLPEYQRAMVFSDLKPKLAIVSDGSGMEAAAGLEQCSIESLAASVPGDVRDTGPEDPAYVMFTSGSTGRPKGVVIPQRGIIRLVVGADYAEFGPGRRFAFMSSPGFDASTLEIWGALLHGGTCVVLEEGLASLERLSEFLVGQRLTDAWLTAGLFNAAVDYEPGIFRGMRQVLTGGEAASPRHMRRFLEVCPHVRLINGYGPTENTTFTLCHTVSEQDVAGDSSVPIGRAIRGTRVRIVDAGLREVATGEIGELCAGGEGVGLGYLGLPELTAERFVSFPGDRGTWYRTGDMVRQRPDGVIEYLGRADRQVKLRGFRIELEEVEQALLQCPGVTAGVVGVVGDTPESRVLVACCAVENGTPPADAKDRVVAWLKARLPAFMVPGEVYVLPRLDLNANGKIDRGVLERARRVQVAEAAEDAGSVVASLQSLFRLMLGVQEATEDTDFFGAGGHSLLVIRLVAEIRRRWNVKIRPSSVYTARTPARLAALIGSGARSWDRGEPFSPRAEPERGPCSIMQRGLIYEWGIDRESSLFHEFAAFIADRGFDAAAFKERLRAVVRAFPVFRTVVAGMATGLEQRVLADLEPRITVGNEVLSWEGPPEPVPDGVLREIRAPFDLEHGPLVRAHIFRVAGGRSFVAIVFHHMVIDEWSLNAVLGLLGGGASDTIGAHSPMLRYVEWERRNAETEEAQRRGEALLEHVSQERLVIASARGEAIEHVHRFGGGVLGSLEQFAKAKQTTLFSVLLCAYGRLVSTLVSDESPWIMTPFANRRDSEVADTIGCCIDMRLMQLQVPSTESFSALVERTHRRVLEEHDLGPVPVDGILNHARDKTVAREVALQFGMTFRLDPLMKRVLGGVGCEPVRVPVERCKFGLLAQFEVHDGSLTCVFEGASKAFSGQRLATLGLELERLLVWCLEHPEEAIDAGGLGARQLDEREGTGVLVSEGGERRFSTGTALLCQDIWCKILGTERVSDESDFFQEGGSSFQSLRLAAQVQQSTGRAFDLGKFVERPTFLQFKVLADQERESSIVGVFGSPMADYVIIGLPGLSAPSVSFYGLWRELSEGLDERARFCSVDFRLLMEPMTQGRSIREIANQLGDLVQEQSGGARYSLIAYSIGGILAVDVGRRLAELGHAPDHVWLLDTYAPELVWMPKWRRLVNAAKQFSTSPGRVIRQAKATGKRRLEQFEAEKSPEMSDRHRAVALANELHRKVDLTRAFLSFDPGVFGGPVTMVASAVEIDALGIRIPGTLCGMDRFLKGPTESVRLNVEHLEFLRSGAGEVAKVIRPRLRALVEQPRGAVAGVGESR